MGASFATTALWWASPDIDGYFAEPDDGGWVPGNPTLTFRYRRCLGNTRTACTGFSSAISFGVDRIDRFFTVTNPRNWFEPEDNQHLAGMMVHQDVTVSAVDHFVAKLIGFYAKDTGDIYYQFDIGFLLHTPIANERFWKLTQHEKVAVTGLIGIAFGYRPVPRLVLLSEIRTDMPITDEYILLRETRGWLNLGLQGELKPWYPYLRIGFPLTKQSQLVWSGFEMQLEIGLTFEIGE